MQLLSALLQIIKLFLPVLFPAWNFFDRIGPSPRIQYACLADKLAKPQWREFRPVEKRVSPFVMLARLFFNKWRNERLFLLSCAERLTDNEKNTHAEREIKKRIEQDCRLGRLPLPPAAGAYLQFRIVLVQGRGVDPEYSVVFCSEPWSLQGYSEV